jgi:hypothetical protein
MPLVDLILSFTKKHSTVYNTFIETWLELRDLKQIEPNLGKLYECLAYEQTKQISYKCLEYFIDNELAYSIYRLGEVSSKAAVMDFFTKVVAILPNEHLTKLGSFFDLLFSSKKSDELPVALVYSERIVVFGCGTKASLVDYALRFFFDGGSNGEYARACLVYLLCSRATFEYLKIIKFIDAVVQESNRMFMEIEEDAKLYLSLIQFVCYCLKKEGRANEAGDTGCRMAGSPVLEQISIPHLHPIEIYEQILENVDSPQIRAKAIRAVIENIRNTPEHVEFIRRCVRNTPQLIAPYFIRKKGVEWEPLVVYENIRKRRGKRSGLKIPRVCHFGRARLSVVGFLIENRIADAYLFLFMFNVSRSSFLGCFDEVIELFKGHETFWSDLWHLFLS